MSSEQRIALDSTYILLGWEFENNITTILFDISPWVNKYGAGRLEFMTRYTINGEYTFDKIELVKQSESIWQWTVKEEDIIPKNGDGQLAYYIDGTDKKVRSHWYKIQANKSIENGTEKPSHLASWIDTLVKAANDILNNIKVVADASKKAVTSANDAKKSENSAKNSANSASLSANSASTDANRASNDANLATQSSINSKSSADNAATDARIAKEAATLSTKSAEASESFAKEAEKNISNGCYIKMEVIDGRLIMTKVGQSNTNFEVIDGRLILCQ